MEPGISTEWGHHDLLPVQRPPIMSERIPFFLAAEVAGEMHTTLYRLPYLPLLEKYVRPCQPRPD